MKSQSKSRRGNLSRLTLAAAAALVGMQAMPQHARAADQFFAGDGSAFSASKWGSSAAGPFTSAFVSGNVANFATVSGTGTGASLTIGGITATEDFTLTSVSGTISNLSNGVIIIDVATGKTVDFSTQSWTTSATAGYTKNGAGVFASAGNTFGGGFTLNNGTVIARGVNAMGGTASNVLTINGGVIAANATRDFTGKFGGGIVVGGNFTLGATTGLASSAANLTFSNNMALGAATRTVTIGGSGNYTLGGVISGAAGTGLTVASTSTGVLVLTNGGNSYSGNTTIQSGAIVSISGDTPIGASTTTVALDGGTLRNTLATAGSTWRSSHGFTLSANGGTIDISAAGAIVIDTGGSILGAGNTLTKAGVGTFRYMSATAALSTFQKLVVNAGTWQGDTDATFGAAPTSPLADAITLNGGGISANAGFSLNVNRGITLGASGGTINATSALVITGAITGSGNLTKTGASTLTINGAKTYSGAVNVNAGPLTVDTIANTGVDSSLGNGNTTSTVTLANGTLDFKGVGGADASTDRPFVMGAGDGTFRTSTGNGKLTLTGAITGAGLTKYGTGGTLVIQGAKAYTGAASVAVGTLSIDTVADIGTASSLGTGATTPTVTIGSSTVANTALSYTGANNSTNRPIALSAALTTNSGIIESTTNTLTVNGGINTNGKALAFDGAGSVTVSTLAITGAGSLTKNGTGVLTLSTGLTQTYTGITQVNKGEFSVDGTLDNTGGTVTVGDGVNANSGLLSGTGTINRAVSIANGGTVAPGHSTGKLSAGSSFTLTTGAKVSLELDGDGVGVGTPGTNFDQIAMTGISQQFTTGGATLVVVPLANAVTNQAYRIVDATGNHVTFATVFANLPQDTEYDQGLGVHYKVHYDDNFIDLTFTEVPEPASGTTLTLIGAGLLARRRRAR